MLIHGLMARSADDDFTKTYLKRMKQYFGLLIFAFLVYGGCSTVFLKIQGDRLKEFASVELFDGLTVTEYDKTGKEKIILRDSTNKAGYIRYKNYKPSKNMTATETLSPKLASLQNDMIGLF